MRRSKLIAVKSLTGVLSVAITLAAATLLCTPVCAAGAPQPWWRLGSSSAPAVLQEGQAKNEVQEIKVAATGGDVTVLEPKSLEEFEKTANSSVLKYGCMTYDASAAEAQGALEEAYGAGNVQVSGGPGDQTASKPYVVAFVGGRGNQALPLVDTSFPLCAFFRGKFGLDGQALVGEQVKGRPDGDLVITAANLGDAALSGETSPVVITDRLPAGLAAVSAEGFAGVHNYVPAERGPVNCAVGSARLVTCSFAGTLPSYETIEVQIGVVADGAKSGEVNEVAVSGGEAVTPEPLRRPIAVGKETPFGVESYEMEPEQEGGATDTQAGSHPFQLTTTTMLNSNFALNRPPAMTKDLSFHLPPGLIGNPTVFPQCTEAQFHSERENANACPNDTAVGVASIDLLESAILGHQVQAVPLFNLVPAVGEPARFGFEIDGVDVYLDTSVRTGSDYGVTVSVKNISQIATFLGSTVTFWGVPGAAAHDSSRGWSCIDGEARVQAAEKLGLGPCRPLDENNPAPLLSLPTSCTGPLQTSVEADSWLDPGAFESYGPTTPLPALDGCNHLPFEPSLSVAPDSPDAASPSGLTVDVHVPQQLVTEGEALAESTLRNTTVALPQGVTVNPGGGDGLEACSEGQIGYLGHESPGEVASELFSATLPSPFCPPAAKLGTVRITTPLLPNPLTGAVYLASPAPAGEAGQNPFRTLLAMYIVAEDPVSGTLVKLPGRVELNQSTGQLVSIFEDTPQLPFEDLTLHFFGGDRAPLATPGLCGAYTTKAIFTPWSGNAPVESSSTLDIVSGPNGSPCPSDPRPFTPEFQAGTTNIQAGAFSELRTTMGHPDADQTLGGLKVIMPPGLMGSLAGVKLCGEPQASEGACGPESLIGHTVVTAGLGSTPVVVKRAGGVYITGPYDGAPFGLSIVNPAESGPFNLGNVVVRARVEVNPYTAQLTIVSDPLPTMLKGVPLDLQHVQVAIDRPDFTFNPTNCAPMKIEGEVASSEGASAAISTPFQVTNCATLGFKPSFAVSSSGKTSRLGGASLHVKLTYPNAAFGSQANIKRVRVELPKALPSRLSTLNHACLASVFDQNPASCPPQSRVGFAKAVTPVLPVPLQGTAYFVSHGGQKFPELIVVLQGYGVTVDLAGETFISNTGITSSTFNTVPDVPVSSFELTLPQGEYSALAANTNLCAANLTMPTTFDAQNGASLEQDTPIEVEGCPLAIAIRSHKVSDHILTLRVTVPGAGKLTAGARGLRGRTASASRRSTLTLKLPEGKPGRLRTTVLVSFTPKTGKQRRILRKSVAVTFR